MTQSILSKFIYICTFAYVYVVVMGHIRPKKEPHLFNMFMKIKWTILFIIPHRIMNLFNLFIKTKHTYKCIPTQHTQCVNYLTQYYPNFSFNIHRKCLYIYKFSIIPFTIYTNFIFMRARLKEIFFFFTIKHLTNEGGCWLIQF